VYWFRPEEGYFVFSIRLGELESGFDKWYEINSEVTSIIHHHTKIIEKKVLTILDKCYSNKIIVENIQSLKKINLYDDIGVFHCALRNKNEEISKQIIRKIVDRYNEDDCKIDWVINERAYFINLQNLVKKLNWFEIQTILDKNKENFFNHNRDLKV